MTDIFDRKRLLLEASQRELNAIADWWQAYLANGEGGVCGELSEQGEQKLDAPVSVILSTRMLWFYSTASACLAREDLKASATQMFNYIVTHFVDDEYGGLVWSVNANGQALDGRKQVYAQAFGIYALSAYYELSKDQAALALARSLFELLEAKALDQEHGGYTEAFSAAWLGLDDVRLSEKDLNSPKTMNTHLHVLEAYSGLYRATGNLDVKRALENLVECYIDRFYDPNTKHLRMFQSIDWRDESEAFSYGHDIESSWLISEALGLLGNDILSKKCAEPIQGLMASCLAEGLSADGSVYDEFLFSTQCVHKERLWWVQAEALVGFLNAYTLTCDEAYFKAAEKLWGFIQSDIIDPVNGEWRWLALSDQVKGHQADYKVGFWKGPYHNGRAMIEVCSRLGNELGCE